VLYPFQSVVAVNPSAVATVRVDGGGTAVWSTAAGVLTFTAPSLQVTAKEIVDVGGQTVSNTLSPDAWTAVATDQRGYSCDAERLTLFFSVGGTSVSNIYRRSSPAPSGLPSAAPPGQPSLSPPVGPSGGTGSATCGSHDGLVTFCGSATIVVTVGGKTLRFEHRHV